MTSSMTSQEDLKLVPLYSLINEKLTFFIITEQITEISSLYFVYVLVPWDCEYAWWITSLVTSLELKVSQNFELQ